jgi:hypothetical protein
LGTPEKLTKALSRLPDEGAAIKQIIIDDHDLSNNLWHSFKIGRSFRSAASTDRFRGQLRFYPSDFFDSTSITKQYLSHEWAHLIEESSKARQLFEEALELENELGRKPYRQRSYAGYNSNEDWAVHLGEVILADDDSYLHMLKSVKNTPSQYKVIFLADALKENLKNTGPHEAGNRFSELSKRIDKINQVLLPSAQKDLLHEILNSDRMVDHRARALKIYSKIGDRAEVPALISLAEKEPGLAYAACKAITELNHDLPVHAIAPLAKRDDYVASVIVLQLMQSESAEAKALLASLLREGHVTTLIAKGYLFPSVMAYISGEG